MLLDVVERHADAELLVDAVGGRTWTYAEAHAAARGIARELAGSGVEAGSRVALAFDDREEMALHYLGCLYAGSAAVPLPPDLPDGRRQELLALVRPSLVLEEPLPWSPEPGPAVEIEESRIYTITFTSGTTSRQKGVAQTAGSMLGAATAFAQMLGYGPRTRLLHVLPMTYMAGVLNTLLCPFVAGGTAVLGRPFDARSFGDFWEPIVTHGVNTLWTAPSMLAGLLRLDRDERGPAYGRRKLAAVSVGTAPLSDSVRTAFEERYGVPLLESYGLSELLFVSTGSPLRPNPRGSVGRLLPQVEVRVEEDGELLVRTPFAMAGYLGDDGEPIPPSEWFPTGDLGRLDDAGDLFVTGRKKDLIIRGGVNVSPRAVEATLERDEAVARAAVVGLPHELLGEEVVACVELADGRRLEDVERMLLRRCRAELPAAAVPGRFVQVEALPTGPTGKVRKSELLDTILAGRDSGDEEQR